MSESFPEHTPEVGRGESPASLVENFVKKYEELQHAPNSGVSAGFNEMSQLPDNIIDFFEHSDVPSELGENYLTHKLGHGDMEVITQLYREYIRRKLH